MSKNKSIDVNVNLFPFIEKSISGEIDFSLNQISIGTPLEVGKKYIIDNYVMTDDFSNCGYIVNSLFFIATNTTPNIWTGSTLYLQKEEVLIYKNNIDPSVSVEKEGITGKIKITNGGFTNNKTIPNIIGGSFVEIVDSNTIVFSTQMGGKYFKIEVLN